jgi:hypothetical protein
VAGPKHRKKDMRFGTWNFRSLYRAGSLKTIAKKLGENKLELVGAQGVRWEGQRIVRFFFLWSGE